MSRIVDETQETATQRAARHAPPGASVPIYREALRVEAHLPSETATHYAIAKELRDRGALAGMSPRETETLVRHWRTWPLHRMHMRHWRAWAGTL